MLPCELESGRHPVAWTSEQHNCADCCWGGLGGPYQEPGGYCGECRYRDNRDGKQLPAPDAERDPAVRTADSASRIDFCDGASLA